MNTTQTGDVSYTGRFLHDRNKTGRMALLSNCRTRYVSALSNDTRYNVSSRLAIQIVILQVFYYINGLLIFWITATLLGWKDFKGLLFSFQEITVSNSFGLTLIVLWMINSLLTIVFMTIIIGRSKLVWDFALTIHFIHLVLVCYSCGFPWNGYWWMLQIIDILMMVGLGTYFTRWFELRDKFFENINDIEMGQV